MTHTASTSLDKEINRKLMALTAHGGRALTLAVAVPLVSGALLVGHAVLLSQTLGRAIEDGESLLSLMPLIVGMIAIILVRATLGIVGEWAGQIGAERIKASVRADLFARLLAHRYEPGIRTPSGAMSAAIVDQVERLEAFFAKYLPAMISAAILPVAFAVVVVPVDWVVALLFVVTAPLIPVFMALAGLGAQAATDRQAMALSRLSAHFADRLRGLLTLKLFGREADAMRDVHRSSESLRLRTNTVLRIAFLSSAILEFFAALGVAGVALYVGLTYLGFLGLNPDLTLTAGLFALIMAPEIYNPLRQLAAHYHDRAAAKSALSEIERQANVSSDTVESAAIRPVASTPRQLIVRNLRVDTAENQPILDDLDLTVQAAESVSIMGPSGVGKSTLARAILGLLPASGDIALNGVALSDWSEPNLRSTLAYVGQRPQIFSGSIYDNIAFANTRAKPSAVARAADLAHVSPFSDHLVHGLHTMVGEGGMGLSGGQIQRVGLARLFLTNPELIVLDEPTAHLDSHTEALVLDNIFAFAEGRMLIVMTHADAVARRTNRVLRMASGKLFATPHHKTAKSDMGENRA